MTLSSLPARALVPLAAAGLLLMAAPARAQLQDGDILISIYQCPVGARILGFQPDGTSVLEVKTGTGSCWEGATFLPGGRVATTRRTPAGVNVFDATGAEVATFDTPQLGLFPGDLDVFADGTFVVCGQISATVELYTPAGAHAGTLVEPGIDHPFGCHVDANDDVWITDLKTIGTDHGRILRFARNGTLQSAFATPFEPGDLVTGPDGTLWITDRNKGLVRHLLTDGTPLGSFPAVDPALVLTGIGMLPDQTLVVSGVQDSRILRFDQNGGPLGSFDVTTSGNGEPLFIDVVAGSTWTNLGQGLAGAGGVPSLQGLGDLSPGATTLLTLSKAAPNAPSVLILGLAQVDLPLLGGTLVPAPNLLFAGIPTGGTGTWTLAALWPAAVPSGQQIFFQTWLPDAQGPAGFAASNGLRATVP